MCSKISSLKNRSKNPNAACSAGKVKGTKDGAKIGKSICLVARLGIRSSPHTGIIGIIVTFGILRQREEPGSSNNNIQNGGYYRVGSCE